MSEQQDKEMESAAERYAGEVTGSTHPLSTRFRQCRRDYLAGWKAASERKDAEIEGIRADRDALDNGNIALNEKLATALAALEWYAGDFNGKQGTKWNGDFFWYENHVGMTETADGGKVAHEALAKIKGEK